MRYNDSTDNVLAELYNKVGATTAQQKYNALILELGYQNDVVNFSHDPTWEQKLTIMELELLERLTLP